MIKLKNSKSEDIDGISNDMMKNIVLNYRREDERRREPLIKVR